MAYYNDSLASRTGAAVEPVASTGPTFDTTESDDAYFLGGTLPSVDQDNVSLTFPDSQTLVVNGNYRREYETPEYDTLSTAGPYSSERRYWARGSKTNNFQRVFTFPEPISQDEVQADLDSGILSVTLPKESSSVDVTEDPSLYLE
ncbi:hypothetical protein KEM55_004080 [Ascosphaera atra]|nr:hypothetical protein KEM55_004080 [Ascosphaera atra]